MGNREGSVSSAEVLLVPFTDYFECVCECVCLRGADMFIHYEGGCLFVMLFVCVSVRQMLDLCRSLSLQHLLYTLVVSVTSWEKKKMSTNVTGSDAAAEFILTVKYGHG